MKRCFQFVFLLCAGLLSGASPVWAEYTYAHADGEYIVTLPEAPVGVTIWADDKENPVPLLESPPKYGAAGEIATFKRVSPDTGDSFEVTITFLRADRDFLLSMTEAKMRQTLEKQYEGQSLESTKFNFSAGTDTLKWATYTGFSVDEKNNLYYNGSHYLTGLESLMLIKAKYNAENKDYQKYYDAISGSIKYTGK